MGQGERVLTVWRIPNWQDSSYTKDMDRQRAEQLFGGEWADWYLLTPQERWRESEKLWEIYLEHGGSLDPEPDTQSPFYDAEEWRSLFGHGRTGVRVLRRCGV